MLKKKSKLNDNLMSWRGPSSKKKEDSDKTTKAYRKISSEEINSNPGLTDNLSI